MNNNLYYLFEITLNDDRKIFLTSYYDRIKLDNNLYTTYSNLNVQEASFDDSAQNHLKIEGCYQENGIDVKIDLSKSSFVIYEYYSHNKEKKILSHYMYKNHTNIENNNFIINLSSISDKLNQSLLNFFSKTCRAKLGDKDCGVNLEDYKVNYKIQSIDSNVIILESCDHALGYFTGGKVCFANSSKSFIIDQHYNNIIRLSSSVPIDLIHSNDINIYPTCDKEFRTCCKNFNNAVNFRGEPFAPTYINLLK